MPITIELFTSRSFSSEHHGYTSIFNDFYMDIRSETLITKEELNTAGIISGDTLKAISFFITELPDGDLKTTKIGIKHSTRTVLTATIFDAYSTYQQVSDRATITKASLVNNAWVAFPFLSDFTWNGVDNISITIIRDSSTYSNNGRWRVRQLGTNYYKSYAADNNSTFPFDTMTGSFQSPTYGVPAIQFTIADRTVSTPVVMSIVTNKAKISDETGMNQSIITVKFDKDVTQYVARLNGVDYNTGTLVHTGGAVSANTDAQIIIDWNELTTEGSNRINVYGQNANGWTTQ